MCRFIAALTLFAAVKHDRRRSAEDCAVSHILVTQEVDPPGYESADYEGIVPGWQS
jgi:hypothetical protein